VLVERMLADLLASARIDVGSSAVLRGCQRGSYDLILLAHDAAPDLLRDVQRAAADSGIRVIRVDTRTRLGKLASSRRPSSSVGVQLTAGGTLNLYSGPPLDWAYDLLIWFHPSRFTHLEHGYKRATLRQGLRRPYSFELGAVDASSQEIRGQVTIDQVVWLKWGDVEGSADILSYEYPSDYPQLAVEMLEIYPELEAATWMTYYRFSYASITM
jgi:ribosomal protein L7Ae-like RNA K-turn-binding protein